MPAHKTDVARRDIESALAAVAGAMLLAVEPWWIIGSGAAWLHGVATDVADIDLLTSEGDAERVIARLGLHAHRVPSPLFRSRVFARWPRTDRDVEIMGGLAIATRRRPEPVVPATRVAMGGVYVPDRADLIAILTRFGRPKDIARGALLAAP